MLRNAFPFYLTFSGRLLKVNGNTLVAFAGEEKKRFL